MIVQVDSTQRYTETGAKLCAISVLLPQAYKKCMKRLTGEHSNNFAEVAAILDALTMLVDTDHNLVIETDSQVAWGWIVKDWKIHDTTLEKEKLAKMIDRCRELLARNDRIKLRKIPRDKNMSDLSRVNTEDLWKLDELDV